VYSKEEFMNIKILGTGCAKCNQLENVTKEVLKEMGLDIQIDHVKDIQKIMEYPILTTPGLVINEELVLAGRVPSRAEVIKIITTALAKEST
jgi:small redox-active disulfide protein 2